MYRTRKNIIILLVIACGIFAVVEQGKFYNIFLLGLYEVYLCCILVYFLKEIFCKELTSHILGLVIIACVICIYFLQKNSFILLFETSFLLNGFHSN